uniref:Anillin n=1 Tax=Phallusia mammillata TaxID=59560 RepID=A0A6F9D5Y0_9ASCI|nr:actin-binding protein anillin-like [Phallusia mammillata]
MPSEMDDFTRKLLERTRARQEAMQQKMMQHSAQSRKRRPLEDQENVVNSATEQQSMDDGLKPPITGQAESPNKRSRMESDADIENDDAEVKETKSGASVSQRMKRLINQRKQWEAADTGEEIDFTCVVSPVQNDPSSPTPTTTAMQRKIDIERKARMAALAQKVNSWEDDLSHAQFSSEKVETPKSKPIGRRTPLVDAYTAEIYSNEQETAAKKTNSSQEEVAYVPKNISKRVSLSIETLSQFAGSKKPTSQVANTQSATPTKSFGTVQTKLGGNKITLSSWKNDESQEKVPSHQVTPTTKSLQQRLLELQKNGVKADQTELDSEEKTFSERQDEIDEAGDELDEEQEDDRKDSCMGVNIDEDANISECQENDESMTQDNADTGMKTLLQYRKVQTSFPHVEVTKTDRNLDEDEEILDESTVSYGDSMMDDSEQNDDEPEDNREDGSKSDKVVEDGSEDTMIDELFDGVEFEDDEEDLLPPRSTSPLTIPSLTRQKSKMEIKSELTVRKQTCNEAEDMHSITRQPSRRLRPLARSNSTESVRSFGEEEKEAASANFPVFTIDAYRTEKRKSLRKTDKKVVRNESPSHTVTAPPQPETIKKQISHMLDEVQQQQRVIQQASAALNCCYDAQHGKGSITELEAEKLLLISSEKRLALLAAIQDMKTRPNKISTNQIAPCSGSITLDQIRLPLRTEYIFSMANKKDGGEVRSHYYFILVRCGARKIHATHLASTHDSLSGDSLVFKDKFQLNNLESDFQITIEVFSKNHKSRADGVPHQEKSKSKFSGILHKSLTPRKTKSRGHGTLTHTASPGGPNAIRISSFSLIGSVNIRLDDVNQEKFSLQKVPFLSPISGQFACRIAANFKSNIEQRGFLTMFDDVGGLGAWHRRWCALIHGVLYSWTYPDDEKHKTALSEIKLKECISARIDTVERIRCARPNTFELRTMRPRRHGDRDNLISQDTGSVITTKHWLAADTKEERVAWIDSLNQALFDVRAWDSNALKPLRSGSK